MRATTQACCMVRGLSFGLKDVALSADCYSCIASECCSLHEIHQRSSALAIAQDDFAMVVV